MIDAIHVRNLALIRECEMRFHAGLTVLTGETGAGKTALLGAIKLAIGERADVSAVRENEDEALVEAAFECDGRCREALAEAGFPNDGDEMVVRRRVSASGNSRCHINDTMATVGALNSIAGRMVDLHGQHEHQALLNPANHLAYLDRWARDAVEPLLASYVEAWERYHAALDELRAARESERVSDYRLEQARFACEQIGAVSPGETEYDELESRLPVLRNGEALAESSGVAYTSIRSEGAALDALQSGIYALERVAGTDPSLDALADRMRSAQLDLEDLAMELRSYHDDVEFDPEALQEALNRLGELDGLVRRFGPTYEAMLETWRESRELVESASDAPERISRLESTLAQAQKALEEAGASLDRERERASVSLCEELSRSVAELAMTGAVFAFSRDEASDVGSWGKNGPSRFELMYAPSPQMTPRPLARIASGGELSRVMLALETVMDDGDPARTLVFDEVDSGVGGATAQTVAARLSDLARGHQVIVVTHLAQIAAVADAHLLVEKSDAHGIPETEIREISGEERVVEISRMLSGTTDAASMEHARSMLASGGAL